MAAEKQVVFLSLYGEDVPDGVPSYLKSGLERSGVSVLRRDNKVSEDLRTVLNKIRESSFVLVIFSVGFAKSRECLDELVLVKKRMDIGKLRTIPIYYKLEPEDVIRVQGLFGKNLLRREEEEHKTAMRNNMEALLRSEVRIKNWREALKSVTTTRDFMYREEDDFIEKLTKQVNKAFTKDDPATMNQLSQITIKKRKEDLLSLMRSMGLGFEGNFSWETYPIDKLSKQCEEQLSKLLSEETKKKEGANPIPVFEKSPTVNNQVFISFRGQDVRSNFVSHLIRALQMYGINVALDIHETVRGQSPFESISRMIKGSSIALVVFTQNYLESKWCLQELMVIKKYMDEGMLRVIPIFYMVEPRDMRIKETGVFGKHSGNTDKDTILAWDAALRSVSARMGIKYDASRGSSESELVMNIVAAVQQLLAVI
ncbi:PREDICTED: uncharacterized protein LOC104737097 [Camelina sativa]|uniref:Uncharacterized protein LOC104737097 n=1 Tax=Camelina sativa TaxID=90675 RepID=A0ABM0VFR9_CAMSA|nr:PREDICTED: uncharacterized protein LOC104737097 [Camelina sativa]